MLNTSSKKNDQPLKIGITGGIGSGKTTICSIFTILGIPVFEADKVAKKIMDEDSEISEKLINWFGPAVYNPDATLNRKFLASVLFNDKIALEKVNQVVHPAVRNAFFEWHKQQNSVYVIHEAAILFESGFYKLMDFNILVSAPLDLRLARVMARDNVSKAMVLERMSNQWDDEEKIKFADAIIYNNEKDFLTKQIIELDDKIRRYGKVC